MSGTQVDGHKLVAAGARGVGMYHCVACWHRIMRDNISSCTDVFDAALFVAVFFCVHRCAACLCWHMRLSVMALCSPGLLGVTDARLLASVRGNGGGMEPLGGAIMLPQVTSMSDGQYGGGYL